MEYKSRESEASMSAPEEIPGGQNGIAKRPVDLHAETFVTRLKAVSNEMPLEGAAKAAYRFKSLSKKTSSEVPDHNGPVQAGGAASEPQTTLPESKVRFTSAISRSSPSLNENVGTFDVSRSPKAGNSPPDSAKSVLGRMNSASKSANPSITSTNDRQKAETNEHIKQNSVRQTNSQVW